MKIRDIMTRGVEVISPDASIQEAATKMKTLDVGVLPVCENDRVIGVLTDRDIVVRGIAERQDLTNLKVRDAMTREAVWCTDDETVREVARLMEEKQIRRVLVMDENRRLVGIVSLGDIAVDTGRERLAGEVLERVSEPARPAQSPPPLH